MRLQIFDVESRLAANRDLIEARRLLLDLAKILDTAQTASAVAAIEAYLESGRDARTGLAFDVSPDGGTLEESPSLRCWLLDLLGCLDPVAAASQARRHLTESRSRSGGESALAMRNLVWGSGQPMTGVDRQIFGRASLEHLSNTAWSAAPEAGYLEGFDAAVFLPSKEATECLTEIVAQPAEADSMRFSAGLALERIAEGSHPDSLAAIAASSLNPATKGDLLSRADPANGDAMRTVEAFLANGEEAEAQIFFWRSFPQASRAMGPRLISQELLPTAGGQMDRDRAALRVLEHWIVEGSFQRHDVEIRRARARLLEFLGN